MKPVVIPGELYDAWKLAADIHGGVRAGTAYRWDHSHPPQPVPN